MPTFNMKKEQIQGKIVYYGPGLCGKTTNLEFVNKTIPNTQELMSLATEGDRTIFFDYLPMHLGKIRGIETKFKLYTVPGQVKYNLTRKMVLKNVDGIVFVADSQKAMMKANIESWQNLFDNMKDLGIKTEDVSIVLQYNKQDLKYLSTIKELDNALNANGYPTFLASAFTGQGVVETLRETSALVFNRFSEMLGNKERIETTGGNINKERTAGLAPAEVKPPAKPPKPPTPPKAKIETDNKRSLEKSAVAIKTTDITEITETPDLSKQFESFAKKQQKFIEETIEHSISRVADSVAERIEKKLDAALKELRKSADANKSASSLSTTSQKTGGSISREDIDTISKEVRKELATKKGQDALHTEIKRLQLGLNKQTAGKASEANATSTDMTKLVKTLPTKKDYEALKNELVELVSAASPSDSSQNGPSQTATQTETANIASTVDALSTDMTKQLSSLPSKKDYEALRNEIIGLITAARANDSSQTNPSVADTQAPTVDNSQRTPDVTAEVTPPVEKESNASASDMTSTVATEQSIQSSSPTEEETAKDTSNEVERAAVSERPEESPEENIEGAPHNQTAETSENNIEVAPEEAAEVASEDNNEVVHEDNTEISSEDNTEDASEDMTQESTADNTEVAPEDNTEVASEDMTQEAPEDNTEAAPEDNTDAALEDNTEVASEDMTQKAPEDDTEVAPEDNTEVASEDMTQEAPEDNTEDANGESDIAAASDEQKDLSGDQQTESADSPPVQEAKEPEKKDPEHANAERVARVMVSDLKLYYNDVVNEALREGNVYERLKKQFDEMHVTFDARIPENVRAQKNYLPEAIDKFLNERRKELGIS